MLISNFNDLTIDAKRSLYDYVKSANEFVSEEVNLTSLEKHIDTENQQINSLSYLKNLGFVLEGEGSEIRLVRSKAAKKFDRNVIIFSAVLVLLFPVSFLMMYFSGEQIPESELNTNAFILMILAVVGLLLGVRAGARIDQNNRKILEVTGSRIVYSNKGKIICEVTNSEDLQVIEKGENTQLTIGKGKEQSTIINVHSSNSYFIQTLKRLREIFIGQL